MPLPCVASAEKPCIVTLLPPHRMPPRFLPSWNATASALVARICGA